MSCDKFKASLIYKLLTANFYKLYAPAIYVRSVPNTLWFLSNLIFGTFLNIKLLFRKACWFPSSKKVSICYRHNSFKPLRTLKGWSAGEEGGGGSSSCMYLLERRRSPGSSREKVKPWFFVTLNIIIIHIFPGNFYWFS